MDVCQDLKTFHNNKFIHSDIKPSNIFFLKHYNRWTLGDYGTIYLYKENNYVNGFT